MDIDHPLLDVSSGVKGHLLQQLLSVNEAVSRRELAALVGVAPGNASSVIQGLLDSGILLESKLGRASMVSINHDHLGVEVLKQFANVKLLLMKKLKERFQEIDPISHAWLFGSVARADSNGQSDIDILIISKDLDSEWLHEKLAFLDADIRRWTGNEVQFIEHTPDSWKQVVASKNRLGQHVAREGVCLKGPNLDFGIHTK